MTDSEGNRPRGVESEESNGRRPDRTGAPLDQSRAVSAVRSLTSRDGASDGYLDRALEGSSLYQWFTTEPDPDPITIDLRRTYTLGPIVRAVDRTVPLFERALERSRVIVSIQRAIRKLSRTR